MANLQIGPGETVTFRPRPSVSILAMRNLREESVRVLLDEEELAVLAPGESTEARVPAGVHRLEARGTTTLKSSFHPLDLPASVLVPLQFRSPTASLTVTNRRGEPLELKAGDRTLGVIGPGERVTFRDIEPGSVQLTARSRTRPLEWTIPVVFVAGEGFEWNLEP